MTSLVATEPATAPAAPPIRDSIEYCACPMCGSDTPAATPYRSGVVAVVHCRDCSFQYLSPRLQEPAMAAHYMQADYFSGGGAGYASYADQEATLRTTFRRLLRTMAARGLTGGPLLEVGCGYGYFLAEAAGKFSQRMGLEMAAPAAARAQAHADAVYVGGVDALPAKARFDCIVALHVIEHVYRPHDFVAHLVHRLNPGGRLILAAPDFGSLWRMAMGKHWPSFKFPEHVGFYNRATICRLLGEAGLVDVARLPYPHAFPLGEVGQKLGLPVPRLMANRALWLPGTTVAAVGYKRARA